ncbi:MAG: Hint domain-containing protein [Kofleriaceae bacterium]
MLGAAAAAAALLVVGWWWSTRPSVERTSPVQLPAQAPPAPTTPSNPPPMRIAPPRDDLPDVWGFGNGCGIDARVSFVEEGAPNDVDAVLLVLAEHAFDPDGEVPVDCKGTVIAELDARLFHGQRSGLSFPFELLPPLTRCGASYTVVVCARQRDGAIALGLPEATGRLIRTTERLDGDSGLVLTPSGPVSPNDLAPGHVVATVVDPVLWGNAFPPLSQTTVKRIGEESVAVTELRLQNGHVPVIASSMRVWLPALRVFREARELSAGDVVLDSRGSRVSVSEVVSHAASESGFGSVELDVEPPDLLFVDDVLVHDSGPMSQPTTAPLEEILRSHAAVRAVPLRNGECSVRVDVEVASIPVGLQSVVIAYARHPGVPGTQLPLDCATASIGAEIATSYLTAIPERSGRRRLTVELGDLETALGTTRPPGASAAAESVQCDTPYAVIACGRDASGALSSFGSALGAWTRSGDTCFASGTPVATPGGTRAIETLSRGDRVFGVDPATGAPTTAMVEALIDRGMREIIELQLDTGTVLRVTAEHPLFDPRAGRFRNAGEFAVGDALIGEAGRQIIIRDRVERGEYARVYDLSVTSPDTFLAGGILAHNY